MTTFKRVCLYGIALGIILGASAIPLTATVAPAVPEIDGSSISAGLGLLAAGILIVRSRRRGR